MHSGIRILVIQFDRSFLVEPDVSPTAKTFAGKKIPEHGKGKQMIPSLHLFPSEESNYGCIALITNLNLTHSRIGITYYPTCGLRLFEMLTA